MQSGLHGIRCTRRPRKLYRGAETEEAIVTLQLRPYGRVRISKWIVGLLGGKTNGAVDQADRPVPSANIARFLGEAYSFEKGRRLLIWESIMSN